MGKVDDSSFFERFSVIDDDNHTFIRVFSGDFNSCSEGKLSMGCSQRPFFQNLTTGCFVAVKGQARTMLPVQRLFRPDRNPQVWIL